MQQNLIQEGTNVEVSNWDFSRNGALREQGYIGASEGRGDLGAPASVFVGVILRIPI